MHVIFSILSFFCILHATAQRKALFVIVDGIPYDVIQKIDPPNLKKLAGPNGIVPTLIGGEKDGKTESPTISAVGYNTVLTGVWANKHNVWDNDIKAPNYNYPTIFRVFKDQYPSGTIGIFSSWLDNRTKLAGDGKTETEMLKFDVQFDGLELDTIQFPHDKEKLYMKRIDEKVTETAAKTIMEQAPDLSWVYLEFTDDMGHRYGDGEKFYNAVKHADSLIGKLLNAIELRQKNNHEEWLMIVTTDHGRDAKTGKDHGGQSPREKTGWIATNLKNTTTEFKKGKSQLVDIFPSIAKHLNISIPHKVSIQLEGKSFLK